MNTIDIKPDSLRAMEVMALSLLTKSIQQTADLLHIHRSAVIQQNTKWILYYCEGKEQKCMRVTLIKAIDDGTRAWLFKKLKNHKIIGPLIKEWREGKKMLAS